MKKFLIVLLDDGVGRAVLAHESAGKWIWKPAPKSGQEPIPTSLREDLGPSMCDVSTGSPDNDRALQCPGTKFDTLTEALAYVRQHDIEVVGDYVGLTY